MWRRVQYSSVGKRDSKWVEPYWLIVNPTRAVDKRLTSALRKRGKATVVEKGKQFKSYSDGRIVLDPMNEAELAQLCKTVTKAMSKRQRLQVGDRVATALQVHVDQRDQHQHRAEERVQEELDRRVHPVFMAPDTDQEEHGHNLDFPEQVEEKEVRGQEDP